MTERAGKGGGQITQGGILYQNSVTALYLGRLLDPRRRPWNQRVVQVRAEAPEHVDDTVVRFKDGHREWIQAKENIRSGTDAWSGLWHDFERQMMHSGFGVDDRLVLAVGSNLPRFDRLRDLCERTAGAEDAEEWQRLLSTRLGELRSNIQSQLLSENPQQTVFKLLARVDVRVRTLEQIEGDLIAAWMPASNLDPGTLFRLLRDRVGGHARVSKVFHPSVLLRDLQIESGVEIEGCDQILRPFEPETVLVDAGAFLMGCDEYENEAPQRPVTLDSYWIGKYPVTNAEYAEFIRQTDGSGRDELGWDGAQTPPEQMLHHPVKGVTFFDALAYCEWLAGYTSRAYRLPTEEEWEKAARGTDGRTYPWGDDWQGGRCNHNREYVTPADAFPAQSVYGCYDMVGNVPEWTHSLWGEQWKRPDPEYGYPWKDDRRNRPDDNPELRRVCRGGSHLDREHQLRCSARSGYLPGWLGTKRKPAHGFRVALSF